MLEFFVEAANGNVRKAVSLLILISSLVPLPCLAVQSVTLAWDPSADASVVGYNLYYGTVSGSYSSRISVSNTTSATVSGLREGVTYFFVVTAYDSSGLESVPSNEVSYSVPGVSLTLKRIPLAGFSNAFQFTSAGTTPGPWVLQATEDFKTWWTLARGTNSPVNVVVVTYAEPAMFFRLAGE